MKIPQTARFLLLFSIFCCFPPDSAEAQTYVKCTTYKVPPKNGGDTTFRMPERIEHNKINPDGTRSLISKISFSHGNPDSISTRTTHFYDAKKKCSVVLLEALNTNLRVRDEWYSTTLPNGKMVNYWHKKLEDGELVVEDTFKYDSQNRLIERMIYNYKGETGTWQTTYKYNRKGLLKKEIGISHWYGVSVKGNEIQYTKKAVTIYRYNKEGKISKKIFRKSRKGVERYAYDKDQNLIYTSMLVKWIDDSQGKKKYEVKKSESNSYWYTPGLGLVEKKELTDGTVRFWEKTTYNEQKKISKMVRLNDKGETISKMEYKYDDKGRLLEEYLELGDKNEAYLGIYEYSDVAPQF